MGPTVPRTIVITVPARNGGNIAFRKAPNSVIAAPLRRGPAIQRIFTPTPVILGKRSGDGGNTENNDPYTDLQPPRKRERLTHLTPEEKLNRRKLKNRVAAQTARDRKKVRTCTLEETVHKLAADNQKLMADNAALRLRLNTLEKEMKKMKKEEKEMKEMKEEEKKPVVDTFGSAASINAPLQRDQVTTLWTLLSTFLTQICKQSSTICYRELNTSSPNISQLKTLLHSICSSQLKSRSLTPSQLNTLMQLWKALRRKEATALLPC